jgi:ABC-type branched-subunit amino acid transport system substrate-binding protein
MRNLALFKEGAAQTGMSLVASAEVDLNAFEADGPGKQLAASKPDAIISFAGYAATAAMAKAALKNGFTGMFLAPSDVGARALARLLGADARGFGIVMPLPVPNDPSVRAVHDFRQSLTDSKLDVLPDEAALEGCLAARVVAEALRRAGGEPTREKLRRALLGNPFELGDYAIDYNEKGTLLSRGPSVVVLGPDGRPRR